MCPPIIDITGITNMELKRFNAIERYQVPQGERIHIKHCSYTHRCISLLLFFFYFRFERIAYLQNLRLCVLGKKAQLPNPLNIYIHKCYAYYTHNINKKQYIIPCRHSKMKHLRYWKMDEGNLEQ